ncbi:MAG: PLP-dependent aminotransferase family protein [Elusimicrobia bacterium]|nr:PLP-dependent aminotransferase family protein [Elusimicrobiota bacterium]
MRNVPYVALRFGAEKPGAEVGAARIVEVVAREAEGGGLPPGTRLPPVRVLAHQLGISKNTVQSAMDELVARGLLESRRRLGLFATRREGGAPGAAGGGARPSAAEFLPAASVQARPKNGRIPLSEVFIDPELLPKDALAKCFRRVLARRGLETYYDPKGYLPLREAIAARLSRHGIETTAEEVLVTAGSQQVLDLVTRTLRRRVVATESPAYAIGKALFSANAPRTVGLPVDPFRGIDLDLWERRLAAEKPGLLYVVSRFQNPTGYSYSSAELKALLRMSAKYGFGILEDDWGSDMLSFSDYRPSLRALGGSAVLYANSFTKKVLPALRLGYVVAGGPAMDALLGAKRLAALGGPVLLEQVLFEFLDRGYYDAYLRRTQAELDARYRRCLAALRASMPEGARWTAPGGGPSLWVDLPRRVDLEKLKAALEAKGFDLRLSQEAFFGVPHLHGFRLGYAFLPSKTLERGIEVLGAEVKKRL